MSAAEEGGGARFWVRFSAWRRFPRGFPTAGARASGGRPSGSKRWPAHIFHPPSRTPPVSKWCNDAISHERRSRRAPEKYAPATFSRAADAPDDDVGGAAEGVIPERTRWRGAAGARRRRARSSRADPVARPGRDSGSCRLGIPREPPPRQGIHPRNVLSRRDQRPDRRVTREHVT